MRFAVLAGMTLALCIATAPAYGRGCAVSVPIMNALLATPEGGGLDMAGTPYESSGFPGPAIRFWAHGAYAKANNGKQDQFNKERGVLWLEQIGFELKANPLVKVATPSLWSLHQANWAGPYITACIKDIEGADRTVVETSFVDKGKEGTAGHQGFYAIASVKYDTGGSMYDFDRITGGGGPGKNVMAVRPIPTPEIRKTKVDGEYLKVKVELGKVSSYGDGGIGKPELIKGYRLLIKSGDAPTSSMPDGYQGVRDPKNPGKMLGTIPLGRRKVEVAIPKTSGKSWLVVQLVYDDPDELLSRAVSANSAGIAADGEVDSGSSRGRTRSRRR